MKTQTRMDSDMPQRSYSYGRISTGGKQARGDGLRRQQGKLDEADESWPERVSAVNGWTLDDTLRFTDKGKSAFHKRNLTPKAALTKFLHCIKTGRITRGSVLLIDKLDRISRAELDEAHDLFRDILRAGVWIATRVPERIYRGDAQNSFMDTLEPLWLMYMNHQESVKKQDNCLHAWEAARHYARTAKKVLQVRPPCWLRVEGDHYAYVPEKLALVQRVASMSRKGMGGGEIAARMMQEGIPGLGLSGNWSGPAIYQLLTSRSLIGEYQPHQRVEGKRVPIGPPIPGFYLPALTEAEFEDTAASLRRRNHSRGRPGKTRINILAGLVWEATGRRKLSMQTAHTRGNLIPYLSWGQISGTPRVRYDQVEECIIDTLATLRTADVMDKPEEADEREKRIAVLTAQRVAKNYRLGQLQKAAADPDEDFDALLPAVREAKADLARISKELETLKLESRSGRGEALAEALSIQQLREKASGEEREDLDRRIQSLLPEILSAVWVQSQRVAPRRQIVHVQMWLHNGQRRDVRILPENLCGVQPWELESWDLRRATYVPGEVCDTAGMA